MDAAPLIKEKKPRTEAQIASLEKARLRAKELRATRLQPTLDSDSEEPIEAEQESIPEPAPEITKSKPKPKQKEKVKEVEEPKEDTEETEVKEFRKQIQQSPPITAKKYFNMISGLKKTYIMFDEE